MGSDDLHKKRVKEKRQRIKDEKIKLPYRYLLVCEGERTEPNYFYSIAQLINEKYNKTRLKGILKIDIEGTGFNTLSLVQKAEEINRKDNIGFGQVWCIFDKDSFPDEIFNEAIAYSKKIGFYPAWSNEAFELWYLLHFEYLNSGITRADYNMKLDAILKALGIEKGYQKNSLDMYEFLQRYGNEKFAISNAKRLLELYDKKVSDADKKPATTVYQLIEELNNLLQKEI